MRKTVVAIHLLVASAVFGLAGFLGVVPAIFSCMAFDAPGSAAQPLPWLLAITVGSFPLVCCGAIVCGWICYGTKRYRRASLVVLAPMVNVIVLAVTLAVCGELGTALSGMGKLYVRFCGTAHQRLKWKAEDFFRDPAVIALCKAIEAKDINEIDRLAKAGVNVNAKGRGNMTPLLWAFPMGEDLFGKMLDLGADPNVQLTENLKSMFYGFDIREGSSVMSASVHLADGPVHDMFFRKVRMDHYLKLVLQHGGNPNLPDKEGNTPICSCYGRLEKAKLLLDSGADINHRNHRGETPVIAACNRTVPSEFLLPLLKAGADYRIPDDNGMDLILKIEWHSVPHGFVMTEWDVARAKPARDWLTNEGVDWEAAHQVLTSFDSRKNLVTVPADYKHRPWLPQRPILSKPNANAGK
jgi:uncharacterized protein